MVKTKNYKDKTKLSSKEKLLKYLLENKNPISMRAASYAISVDYKNTYNIINNLDAEIISKEKIGNTNLIKLKLVPNQEIFSIEQKRTKEFLDKNKSLKLIQDDVGDINHPFLIVLIFGSYAKKKNTKNSDIDICIISDNQEKTKELVSRLRLLPLKLEIHDFNIREFESMLEVKKENLAKEIIKYNIILYGIENYYNLVSKWMKKE